MATTAPEYEVEKRVQAEIVCELIRTIDSGNSLAMNDALQVRLNTALNAYLTAANGLSCTTSTYSVTFNEL